MVETQHMEVSPVELALEMLSRQRDKIGRQLDAQPVVLMALQRELQVSSLRPAAPRSYGSSLVVQAGYRIKVDVQKKI